MMTDAKRDAIATCFSKPEAKVLQAQEPVAWFAFADSNGPVPLELWGFDQKACKHAVLENARSVGWKGTIEGYLFQKGWTIRPLVFPAPQPPAPCPRCAARVADLFSEQHKVDALLAENDKLQAKVAQQSALIEKCEMALQYHVEMTRPLNSTDEALAAIAAHKKGGSE